MGKDQGSNKQVKAQNKKKNSDKNNDSKGKKKKKGCKGTDNEIELKELKKNTKLIIAKKLEQQLKQKLPTHYELGLWKKNLKMLSRTHLAPYAKILKMEESHNFCLSSLTGALSSKRKTYKSQFVVQFPNNKRSMLIKMEEFPILLIAQDLCFYCLKLQEFLKIFSNQHISKEDLTLFFRSLREGISEEINDNIQIDDNQFLLWPALIIESLNFDDNEVEETLNNFLVSQDENIKLFDKIKARINSMTSNQSSEILKNYDSKRSIEEPGRSENEKPKSEKKQEHLMQVEDFIDQNNNYDEPIGQLMYPSIDEQRRARSGEDKADNMNKNMQEKQIQNNSAKQIKEERVSFREIFGETVGENTQKKFCLWLIGTQNYIFRKSGLISWSSVPQQNRNQIFKKTQMSHILDSVNQVISALNKFEDQSFTSVKQEDWRFFLYRFSYYERKSEMEEQQKEIQPCIPLRFANIKQGGRKALIRIFDITDNLYVEENEAEDNSLQWVPIEQIMTNYHFPKLTKQQLSLFYLRKFIPPSQLVSHYFYREYYYMTDQVLTQEKIRQIFTDFFPPSQKTQAQISEERCIYCLYSIKNFLFKCCYFCHRYSHSQCSQDKCRQIQDETQRHSAILVYLLGEEDNEGKSMKQWVCQQCQPCSLCFEAVGPNYFHCNVCRNYLHLLCGKLKGLEQNEKIYNEEYKKKYICQSCLKCCMCNHKLRDQQYMLVEDNFFCSNCYQKVKKNQHCHICMKERDQSCSWTLCDIPQCRKWIHDKCDPGYFIEFPRPTTQEEKYTCPICRKKIIRNVYVELIRALSIFDEYQFFIEPSYENIPTYRSIIDEPMCFNKMKQKALAGFYDQDSYELISRDFHLIVNNAFKFNMPQDSAYFEAKILKILGEMTLKHIEPLFQPTIRELIHHQIWGKILEVRRTLHCHINEHYPEILFNYKNKKSWIQVKKRSITAPNIGPNTQLTGPIPASVLQNMHGFNISNPIEPIFHSPSILNTLFKNSTVLFHLKKQKIKIESLFTMPKSDTQVGDWLPIKDLVCYFHNDCNNIIYTCNKCFESYCCVTKCYRHRLCSCGNRGCGCDSFECGCPQNLIKQKERRTLRHKLVSKFSQQQPNKNVKQIQLDITENYKYCWKCARENMNFRMCVYCDKICSYNYKRCQKATCKKIWHKNCAGVNSIISDYPIFCKFCMQEYYKDTILNSMEQCLVLETRSKLIKISKIQKYMKIFLDSYRYLGIRLNPPEIQKLILDNFDQFSVRENLFKQYEINFDLFRKYKSIKSSESSLISLNNQSAISEEFNIYLKIHEAKITDFKQTLREFGGPLFYAKDYLLRSREIWWKYFRMNYIFDISQLLDIQDPHLRVNQSQKYKALVKVCKGWKYRSRFSQRYQPWLDPIQKFESKLLFSIPLPLSISPQQEYSEIYEISTKQIRKKTVENLSSTNNSTLYDYYTYITASTSSLFTQSRNHQKNEIQVDRQRLKKNLLEPMFIPQEITLPPSKHEIQIQQKQKQPICNYASTITQSYFLHVHKFSSNLLYKPRAAPHKYHYNPVLVRKREVNEKISNFLQAIYQRSKSTLRKGNTLILKGNTTHSLQSQNSQESENNRIWVVMKKWGKLPRTVNKEYQTNLYHQNSQTREQALQNGCGMVQVIIKLQKIANVWNLEISNNKNIPSNPSNELALHNKSFIVYEIQDIIMHLNQEIGCKLETFKDLGQYLGFTIYEPFYKANHFTHFLQTNITEQMIYQARINKVKQVYDSFNWGSDGFLSKQYKVSEVNKLTNNQGKQQTVRYQYNMTKVKPYYLSKRKEKKSVSNKNLRDGFITIKENKNQKQTPFITFEDIKKHLESNLPINSKNDSFTLNTKNIHINNEVFIAPSKIHKLGLFSRKYTKKHTIIIEYMGEVISEAVADQREEKYHYGCYMFGIGKFQSHIMQKKDIIDATFRGNMARYLNHSCDPNCKARTQTVNGSPRIFIYTIRDIQQYEQLTYDYQFNVDTDEKLECTCGAKNCQGRLN